MDHRSRSITTAPTLILAVLAGTLLAPAGCGEEADDSTRADGQLLFGQGTLARPEVAIFFSPTGVACGATMISSRTFVTAANCINYAWQAKGGFVQMNGVGTIGVERTLSQGGGGIVDDLAYGRLTQPAAVTPAAISSVEPGPGFLTAIDFGCPDAACSTLGSRNFVEYFYDGSTPSRIDLRGDHGGPVFAGRLADRGPLVRVNGGIVLDSGTVHDYGASAIRFRSHMLAADDAFNNDNGVSYRSQIQAIGWQQAVRNGNTSGTTVGGLRLEGVQIWSPSPDVRICYTAWIQNMGDGQGERCDGELAGTVGQSLRLEAIKIRLAQRNANVSGVTYRVHVPSLGGWQDWTPAGLFAGTRGQSRLVDAIEIRLF